MFIRVCLIVLLTAPPLWSQVDAGAAPAAEEPMATPSPVNVEGPSLAFVAEQEHTNYLRGGLSFSSAYDDGLLSSTGAASDISYTVRPSVAIEESGARLHWSMFYSPGFTFYQRNTSLNQSDHDLTADLGYRLSPHVTLTLRGGLIKSSVSSYLFNPNPIGAETGILQSPNQSVISPIADTISNYADGQLTYQFSANGMIGASGTETEQRYLHPSQVPGLFNSSTRGATAFYTRRLSRKHYMGATYQFQQLLSHPNGGETQTNSAFLFYTLYVNPMLSLALLGGNQRFEISELGIPTKLGWSPAGGAALAWQGVHTSASLSFAHRVSDGGGLQSAVLSNNADLSIRHQLTKNLTVSLVGGYATNGILDPTLPGNGGHTFSGRLSLERMMGEHFTVQMGYARAHGSYSNIPALFSIPDRYRAWVAFSYNFQRPLGR
jgi:hypothetical protein